MVKICESCGDEFLAFRASKNCPACRRELIAIGYRHRDEGYHAKNELRLSDWSMPRGCSAKLRLGFRLMKGEYE